MDIVFENSIITTENAKEVKRLILEEKREINRQVLKICGMLAKNQAPFSNFTRNTNPQFIHYHFFYNDQVPLISIRKQERGKNYYKISYGLDCTIKREEIAKRLIELIMYPSSGSYITGKSTKSHKVYGFIRKDEKQNFYGNYFTHEFIELMGRYVSIDQNFDDILVEFSKQKKENLLVALLLLAGKNDYEYELDFEDVFTQNLFDARYNDADNNTEPINTTLYAFLNDSIIMEQDFNKIMGEGKWKVFLDVFEEFKFGNYSNFSKALNTVKFYTDKRIKYKYHSAVKRLGKSKIPDLAHKAKLLSRILK